jgi:hypothetical protein
MLEQPNAIQFDTARGHAWPDGTRVFVERRWNPAALALTALAVFTIMMVGLALFESEQLLLARIGTDHALEDITLPNAPDGSRYYD